MNDNHPHKIYGDILIVDDELPNLQKLSDLLIAQGHEVRGAKNGRTALDFIAKDQPDLILLDVRMPDMDGFEVCRRLKSDRIHRDIPIIFLSALQESEDKLKIKRPK